MENVRRTGSWERRLPPAVLLLLLASPQKLNSDLELRPIIGCGCGDDRSQPFQPNEPNNDLSTIRLFSLPAGSGGVSGVGVEFQCTSNPEQSDKRTLR